MRKLSSQSKKHINKIVEYHYPIFNEFQISDICIADIKKIQPSYETIYPDILRYVTDTILKEHHGGKLNE